MSYRALPENLQRIACDNLGESPDRIHNDLIHIKEWAEKQQHLSIRTDDQWLISFLRGCKYSLERTKEKLDLLCTLKTRIPEFFQSRDPYLPEIQELLTLGICLPLPIPNGSAFPRIVLFRVNTVDVFRHRVEDCAKLILMILDILLNEDDNFVVSGCHVLVDDSGVSINHMTQFTPSIVRKLVTGLNDAYPLRLMGIHVINAPSFAIKGFDMFKPFINNKVLDKIRIYDDSERDKLYNCIPLSLLPNEYGGHKVSLLELAGTWKTKVESYKEWFREDTKYSSNEALRPEKLSKVDELFGFDGSFRKLNID